MQVVGHIVDDNQLLFPTGNDAGDVFLQLVVMFWIEEVLPAFDGEHNMDINLRVGVGHASKMPLLTELENLFFGCFYKDFTPTACHLRTTTFWRTFNYLSVQSLR